MSRVDVLQKAAEKYRKQIAPDLPADLVTAIIETQIAHSEEPVACARKIDTLIEAHLGAEDQDD